MPIFSRRRLQAMLDELAFRLSDEKARDIVNRLENKRIAQVLPAEMELALLWAIASLGEIDIEPRADGKRPDAYTNELIPGQPSAIEIAAATDNSISGEDAMDGVALAIVGCANRIKKSSGAYLYFRFREKSGYEDGVYARRPLAPLNYSLTNKAESVICRWITSGDWERVRLRIVEPGLDVEVERKARKQTRYHNIWCSMPPEAHSVDDNPLFNLLKRKLDQLKATAPGTLRFIFLADVGSTLLNRLGTLGEIDPTRRRVSGREIISHFITKYSDRIDGIVAFAPQRKQGWGSHNDLNWAINVFQSLSSRPIPEGLHQIAATLPKPRFEGYQARSLFKQGAFSPKEKGWHLAMSIESQVGRSFKVKIPARKLLDLLAGRITERQFRHSIGEGEGHDNVFRLWLDKGMTVRSAQMAPRDLDEDDDHIVLTFDDDPGARPLRVNRPPPTDKEPV